MLKKTSLSNPYEHWAYLIILLNVFVWTLLPAIVRFTLPLDAMEGTTWGHQLEWGYDKNPFMNAWLTTLAVKLGGQSCVYLFSQLSVAMAFWAVWELGKKILPPLYALLATASLACMQYYNLHAIDFNDNTLEVGFWAVTVLFFYHAVTKNTLRDWLLVGVFAGLSVMIKYYTALLLLPMFLFMLIYPETRAQFKNSSFYLALFVFAIIITPHVIWLFSHDFITVNYAFNRVSSPPTWLNHVFFPAQFAWQQIEVFLPAAFLLLMLVTGKIKNQKILVNPSQVKQFDKIFLLLVGMGPFILTVILSAVTGIKLRAGWGQPLLNFWGLFFLAWCMPIVTRARLIRFFSVWLVIFVAVAVGYGVALTRANEPSSANYPGSRMARSITQVWHDTYFRPLRYVVGPRWAAGNIAFYSEDQPSVYIEANPKLSPWIDEKQLRHDGGVFVWDPKEDNQISYDVLKKRFEKLRPQRIMHFSWMRNKTMTPVEVIVAFLPPEN